MRLAGKACLPITRQTMSKGLITKIASMLLLVNKVTVIIARSTLIGGKVTIVTRKITRLALKTLSIVVDSPKMT